MLNATSFALKMRPFNGAMLCVLMFGRSFRTRFCLSIHSYDASMSGVSAIVKPFATSSRSATSSQSAPEIEISGSFSREVSFADRR